MKNTLLQNYSLIMTVIGWILWVVFMLMFRREKLKKEIYSFMLNAKQRAKDGVLQNAQEQEEWVVKMALQNLPKSWVIFLSEAKLRKIIFYLYRDAMDWADDGKFNVSYNFAPLVPLEVDTQDNPYIDFAENIADGIVDKLVPESSKEFAKEVINNIADVAETK
jgi:hypothetical protein